MLRSSVSGGSYIGQTNEKGRRHGKGILKYTSGDTYDGEFKNNLRHGKGIHKYHTGHTYEVILSMRIFNDLKYSYEFA